MKPNQDSRLFRLAAYFLKFFVLGLFGFAIAYIVLMTFGAARIAIMLSWLFLSLVWRFGLILFCVIAITVIFDSFR
ncbi:hypothetical protein SD80_006510 [Scytonema tolypothrichoides VB-61278]|nr:hypothetical protein SD80_006510 [Scytonema tolypothrichoides VB-61278]